MAATGGALRRWWRRYRARGRRRLVPNRRAREELRNGIWYAEFRREMREKSEFEILMLYGFFAANNDGGRRRIERPYTSVYILVFRVLF